MEDGAAPSSLGCACLGLVSGQEKFHQITGPQHFCGGAVGCHGAVPNSFAPPSSKALGFLGSTGDMVRAPRTVDIISDGAFQSYIPEGPRCPGWAIPAGDLMALFSC